MISCNKCKKNPVERTCLTCKKSFCVKCSFGLIFEFKKTLPDKDSQHFTMDYCNQCGKEYMSMMLDDCVAQEIQDLVMEHLKKKALITAMGDEKEMASTESLIGTGRASLPKGRTMLS